MKGRSNLTNKNGRTNEEVVEHLRSLKGTIGISMYETRKAVLGYTYLGGKTIYTNKRFHSGVKVCDRASNIAHEVSHAMGRYTHPNVDRRSVPYAINYAFTACCK